MQKLYTYGKNYIITSFSLFGLPVTKVSVVLARLAAVAILHAGTSPPDKMAAASVVLSLVLLAVVFSAGLGVVYLQAVQLSSHLQGKWVLQKITEKSALVPV